MFDIGVSCRIAFVGETLVTSEFIRHGTRIRYSSVLGIGVLLGSIARFKCLLAPLFCQRARKHQPTVNSIGMLLCPYFGSKALRTTFLIGHGARIPHPMVYNIGMFLCHL